MTGRRFPGVKTCVVKEKMSEYSKKETGFEMVIAVKFFMSWYHH